jgi:hypothetical protein
MRRWIVKGWKILDTLRMVAHCQEDQHMNRDLDFQLCPLSPGKERMKIELITNG